MRYIALKHVLRRGHCRCPYSFQLSTFPYAFPDPKVSLVFFPALFSLSSIFLNFLFDRTTSASFPQNVTKTIISIIHRTFNFFFFLQFYKILSFVKVWKKKWLPIKYAHCRNLRAKYSIFIFCQRIDSWNKPDNFVKTSMLIVWLTLRARAFIYRWRTRCVWPDSHAFFLKVSSCLHIHIIIDFSH